MPRLNKILNYIGAIFSTIAILSLAVIMGWVGFVIAIEEQANDIVKWSIVVLVLSTSITLIFANVHLIKYVLRR